MSQAAAHKHENEVEWFGRQRRDAFSFQLPSQLNWFTGSMAEKVLEKIGILLNDLARNSSGGNDDKQNEELDIGCDNANCKRTARRQKFPATNVKYPATRESIPRQF